MPALAEELETCPVPEKGGESIVVLRPSALRKVLQNFVTN
jgi:hypothetical protein